MGTTMLMFVVGMAYSVASPIILPVMCGFFVVSFVVLRYQMLYMFCAAYNSGGRMCDLLLPRNATPTPEGDFLST